MQSNSALPTCSNTQSVVSFLCVNCKLYCRLNVQQRVTVSGDMLSREEIQTGIEKANEQTLEAVECECL